MMDTSRLAFPAYILEEKRLRDNLQLIASVRDQAEVKILVAFKAFAMWKAFPWFREYGFEQTTASSVNEALLAVRRMGRRCHTYSPAYTDRDFPSLLQCSEAVTFNSLSQLDHFLPQVRAYERQHGRHVSCGLRINPEYSEVETALYNPCAPGSRLGVTRSELGTLAEKWPDELEGLHFHTLCESDSYALEKTLDAVEQHFGPCLSRVRWLNMGGGHLMTRKGYDTKHLTALLQRFKTKYPHLQLILEPGSAFTWQTGTLRAHVIDIVCRHGIQTALLDVSFACHMPDCLEMPYKPEIRGASHPDRLCYPYVYRMGGNSCLAGDWIGDWSFPQPLKTGDEIIFEDMIHYTTVKTHMFNGVSHPALVFEQENGQRVIWREYGYEDYENRMD
ncbi:MAG: carboxynorspermidine decarboxylase [Bacteroidales bacterium]|nr:carboxynorspermidine decarboxylase [Bacteroidales bacterium]